MFYDFYEKFYDLFFVFSSGGKKKRFVPYYLFIYLYKWQRFIVPSVILLHLMKAKPIHQSAVHRSKGATHAQATSET